LQPAVALPNIISSTPFGQLSWWLSFCKAWAKLRSADDMLSHCSGSAPDTAGNHPQTWAARYNTWLLMKLTPKGVVFSFLSKSPTKSPDGQALCFDARNRSADCQQSRISCNFAVPYQKSLTICG